MCIVCVCSVCVCVCVVSICMCVCVCVFVLYYCFLHTCKHFMFYKKICNNNLLQMLNYRGTTIDMALLINK